MSRDWQADTAPCQIIHWRLISHAPATSNAEDLQALSIAVGWCMRLPKLHMELCNGLIASWWRLSTG